MLIMIKNIYSDYDEKAEWIIKFAKQYPEFNELAKNFMKGYFHVVIREMTRRKLVEKESRERRLKK